MHNISISEEYEKLAETVIDEHPDLHWIRSAGISIGYLESDQEKKGSVGLILGQCSLVKELYQPYCPHDFLITIFLPNVAGLNENQKKILLYHELLHVDMSEINGEPKYHVAPHDVEDFETIINRYGLHWAGD